MRQVEVTTPMWLLTRLGLVLLVILMRRRVGGRFVALMVVSRWLRWACGRLSMIVPTLLLVSVIVIILGSLLGLKTRCPLRRKPRLIFRFWVDRRPLRSWKRSKVLGMSRKKLVLLYKLREKL